MPNLVQHAKATATVLQAEFHVPFQVFDAATANQLWPEVDGAESLSSDNLARFAPFVGSRTAHVTLLPSGQLRLRIPLIVGDTTLVAESVLARIATTADNAAEEQSRLERWAQAVLDRLHQVELLRTHRLAEDDAKRQAKQAWELNLTLERLIRHLRIHRDPESNIAKILDAALPFVSAESVIWITNHFQSVQMRGEPLLSDDDARALIKSLRNSSQLRDTGLLMQSRTDDRDWAATLPQVTSLMVMTVPSGQRFGWLIAINKRGEATSSQFRAADAAGLAPFAALLGLLNKASDRFQELKDLLVGLTRSLASAVDAKDPYTYGHSERVARIAVELGRELRLGDEELSDLYLAGLLHDMGKIGIRDDVLCKSGPLTPEETAHIRQHPAIGHAILKDLKQINSVLPGVLYHHERYDGKGYPEGLSGEQIPRIARILAVADSFDAMSTSRPYRKGLSPASVEKILTDGASHQWDPRVIEAFHRAKLRLRSIHERGLGESLRQALDGALRDTGSSQFLPTNLRSLCLEPGSAAEPRVPEVACP